jgi:pyruvate dehydrogenase E2 component (dihydrolipoamide acetyltransferase)
VPIVVLVGEIQKRPWVDGDRLVVAPVVLLGCTFDHRLIDGAHGGKMAALLRQVVEDPERYLDLGTTADTPRHDASAPAAH